MSALHQFLFHLFLLPAIYCQNLAFSLDAPGQSDELSPSAYRSTVSEVRLVFFATKNDRPFVNLQKDDFAVIDNETVIRSFRSFNPAATIKLDLIVLVDLSGSALAHNKQELAEVQRLVLQWPSGAEDMVSVLSFSGTETHLICTEDCRDSITADRIASSPRGGTTPLFDALETATGLLNQRKRSDVWPVIILFSDGDDTISKTSFHRALENILASEAQVYAVDIGNPGQPANGTAILQKMADDSGGRFLRIRDGTARILGDVIDDLHSAQVVTYALPPSGSDFHSIRIFPTHNLNLQFRSRHGYYHYSTNH
jgi:VWFA-related protein